MDTIPVWRPKSWKREREETRSKHIRKPKDTTDLAQDLSSGGMTSVVSNCNNKSSENFTNRTFTGSQQFGNKISGRCINSHETFVGSVQNGYYGLKSRKDKAIYRKSCLINCVKSKANYPDVPNSCKCSSSNRKSEVNEVKSAEVSKKSNRCDSLNYLVNSDGEMKNNFTKIALKSEEGKESYSVADGSVPRIGAFDSKFEGAIKEIKAVSPDALCGKSKDFVNHTLDSCSQNSAKTEIGSYIDEDLDVTNMAGREYSDVSNITGLGSARNRSVSCNQQYRKRKSELNHILPFRDNTLRCVQSSPKLSLDVADSFVRRSTTELGVLDAYLDKKVNIGSFGDVANIGENNISSESSISEYGMSHAYSSMYSSGDYDDVHKYLLNNGLIGYIVGRDRSVETITVPSELLTSVESMVSSVCEEDRQDVVTYFSEPRQRIYIKCRLRSINSNLNVLRPDDGHFSSLDSSLKKNTTFVRKLKTFTSSQLDNLLNDMASLNLTKYVSEVAGALVECKLKMSDVWAAVQICSVFHQTYSDFSTYFLENWQKALYIKKEEQIANPSKLRVDLRFFAELVSIGVFTRKEGLSLIGSVLTMLTSQDKQDHFNVKIILSFCRHCGDEYAGLVPRKVRLLSEKYNLSVPQYTLLPEEKQLNVRALFKDYYSSLCTHLRKEHNKLQEFSRQNRRILHTKGELGVERKDRLEAAQVAFNQIASDTQLLAEALDEDVPILPEDESLKNEGVIFTGSNECDDVNQENYLWDDDETREFYECFPDLKQLVPSLQAKPPEPDPQISEETLDLEFEEDVFGETTNEEEVFLVELEELEEPESSNNSNSKALLDSFLAGLPNCITKELIDKAAVEFVTSLNTKQNRRKLVKVLFTVPRIRLDLLPFYARFVAILYPVASDVALDLAQMLKRNFKYHIRKKDQMNIESKIKVVRYIGELVKFNMYSKVEGLHCLKVLVQDFSHHHIEMCCNFLESCGRFFFRHPDCHPRMKIYLDQIMRKKSVMALDPRYVTMIENVYYYVNPPEEMKPIIKERLDEEEFIRMLLYEKLEKVNVDEVLCLMQKLSWEDLRIASYAVKCLSRPQKVKYYNIRYMASLVAGLTVDHELEGTQVVDCVLEDIQLGMEINLPEYNQRRLAVIKYLGELYNYRLVENSNIFRVLQALITFGVTYNHSIDSPLDPPENLFRIRLVCTLLATCGEFFSSGLSKRKLDVYLVCFQYYFWFKYSHPLWNEKFAFPCAIKYMFQDTVKSLRPNIKLFTSFIEAKDAVAKLCEQNIGSIKSQYFEHESINPREGELDVVEEESDDDRTSDTGQSDDTTPKSSDELSNDSVSSISKGSTLSEGDKGEITESSLCSQDIAVPVEEDSTPILTCTSENSSCNLSVQNNQNESAPIPDHLECIEDEDFLHEFNHMVSDNLRDRMNEIVKPHHFDIPIPLHVKSKMKQTFAPLRPEESPSSSVDFLLILRKGNKQQFKSLAVPLNSEIAMNLMNHKEAERVEKECVKRLTLNISDRLEEEDYQEMLAQSQRPPMINYNRERRHKYQHPKGAPDADLIFSSQKVR
ncbi:regulator of nonsense transcripts 2 [Anabrus simplex]|uniref:regulator of nonsense transcripts 2 n=1 Tax=Anabrus simplex TaxID=316456 RepID=UPI0035A30D13